MNSQYTYARVYSYVAISRVSELFVFYSNKYVQWYIELKMIVISSNLAPFAH